MRPMVFHFTTDLHFRDLNQGFETNRMSPGYITKCMILWKSTGIHVPRKFDAKKLYPRNYIAVNDQKTIYSESLHMQMGLS